MTASAMRSEVRGICDRLEHLFDLDAVGITATDRPASREFSRAWLSHVRRANGFAERRPYSEQELEGDEE